MASQFDSWESYFYPDTIDPLTGIGTLRNLYDERDAQVLSRMEYTDTTVRAVQLGNGEADVPRTYDGAHLRAIHGHLFQDVYEWAGEYRTVNMSKGPGRGFGDVKTGEVDRYLSDVQQLVTSTDWGKLSRNDFIATASTVFAYVNTGGSALLGCELYAYDLPPLDRARNGDRGVRPRRDHRIRGASAKASSSIERSP